MHQQKAALAQEMTETRARTVRLAALVDDETRCERIHPGYSPFDWHLGHIGQQESFWVLQQAGHRPGRSPDLEFVFANIPENPKEHRSSLPPRDAILAYLKQVQGEALELLWTADFHSPDPLVRDGFAWRFALAHEWQHQETMIELLYLAARERGTGSDPSFSPGAGRGEPVREILVPDGLFRRGTGNPHAYDNERPSSVVDVPTYALDERPVTISEFAEFREDGGYRRRALWDDEGWEWLQQEKITGPEYEGWGVAGPRAANPCEPVMGVSWYEASAYARWAGKRLPTEEEWEKAAAWDPATGETRLLPWGDDSPTPETADHDAIRWHPAPVGTHPAGRSACGGLDLAGGVWEWTSTIFGPYEGFVAFPYDGYSKDHFNSGLRVLKGGSWATRGPLLRCSFRNFYAPGFRQGFLGFRCARTLSGSSA